MRRRELLPLFGGAVLTTWPVVAGAQQASKVWRIGFLGFGTAAANAARVEALRGGLRELGYVDGQNLIIDARFADSVERLQEAAAELVASKAAVIFATSSTEVERARQATKTVPIIFASHADPVGLGHVTSLPRPGGNITGLSYQLPEITAKQVELLRETLPRPSRFGMLWTPTAPSHRPITEAAEAASGKLGIELVKASVETVEDFDPAFATLAQNRVDGVLVQASALTARHSRPLLAAVALKHRLPTMFGVRDNVVDGGLMSYAADLVDSTRRAAVYIDKILKGASPAELPVEQASRYQLVVNLKTAGALDLTVPPGILLRANEVIE
jgi:putative tryptophan/tyrosine transport system substrate-binding protein